MQLAVTAEEARARRKAVMIRGVEYHLTRYIGAMAYGLGEDAVDAGAGIQPVAFLVEQPPDAVTPAHYHQANQFQLVTGGGGTLSRHAIGAASVHYTNAYTPYGPITADPRGVNYFTLRDGYDSGAKYMPDQAPALRAVARTPREMMGEAGTGASRAVLFESADGIVAVLHRLAPRQAALGTPPGDGGGQWWVPLRGSLVRDGMSPMPALSCLFLSRDEPALAFAAGDDGLEVMCLQFARPR